MSTNSFTFSILVIAFACRNKAVQEDLEQQEYADRDRDGYTSDADCDDSDYKVYPDAEEICDGIDNDCDGEVDEQVRLTYYADKDEDGFGDPEDSISACSPPAGYVPFANDCDDLSPEIYTGAQERCNELDDDCDGEIDEGLVLGLFYDADGDGYGDPDRPSQDCSGGEGYVYYGDDCDDSNPDVHPFQLEICDGIDNDCDGSIDTNVGTTYYADADNDGFGDANSTQEACSPPDGFVENDTDCDDDNGTIYPSANEYCNQQDDDCDGDVDEDPVGSPIWYYDIDGDGYGSAFIVAYECDAPLGYVSTNTDCDDTNVSIYPGATEYCNDLDNDCNGLFDDNAVDASTWYADLDRDDFGDASSSIYQCAQPFDYILDNNDCDDSNDEINPDAPELCNAVDDNCDGAIDNNTIDSLIYHLDSDGDNFGAPNQIIETCLQPPGYVLDDNDCDDSDGAIYPGAQEYCDGIDQDCDGNNFYEQDLDGNGYLACEESVWFRNHTANPTNPNGNSSQAAGHLTTQGITIQQFYHGNNFVTASLLQDFGLYVHHGRNNAGAGRAYTNAEANALQSWVYAGGRLLYIGYNNHTQCHIADSIPSQFGFTCLNNNGFWSGDTSTFVAHPITNGLSDVGGQGGENWVVNAPAQLLISISGNEFVSAVEYGAGKVVLVANERPFLNSGSGYNIAYGDNDQLVQNIWDWLLE